MWTTQKKSSFGVIKLTGYYAMAMLTYNHSLYDMQHVNYHYDHYNTRIMIYHSGTKNPTKYRLDNAFKRSQKSNQTSINFRKKG